MSVKIDAGLVCEVFRRYAAGDGRAAREAAPSVPAEQRARLAVFADAVRDVVTGATGDDASGFRAAFDQVGQLASGIDADEMVNSLHVPEGAGEYEGAMRRLLLRIPDGGAGGSAARQAGSSCLREPSGNWRPCVRRLPCTRSRRSTARCVCTSSSTMKTT